MIDKIKCEICENEFERRFSKSLRRFTHLCPICFEKENIVEIEKDIDRPLAELRQENDKTFSLREQYWNDSTTDFQSWTGTQFEKANRMKALLEMRQAVIFEQRIKYQFEYSIYNDLLHKLNAEERAKLGLSNVSDYKPGALNKDNIKPKAPRVSKEDKSIWTIASIQYSKQLGIGNVIIKQLFTEHPEYFSNGEVKSEFEKTVHEFMASKNAMTEKMAIEAAKESLRVGRARTIQGLADGSINLNQENQK